MKNKMLALMAAACLLLGSCQNNVTQLVNPFVGTDLHGHTHPSAIVPFGQVAPGPDTRLEGWDGCSGYHYSDDTIFGFSQTHLSGTGCEDYCDVLVMPVTTANGLSEDEMTMDGWFGQELRENYKSAFGHRHEKASPGYYAVMLDRNLVQVELTSNERCGYHRFNFAHVEAKGFVVDLRHRDVTISAGMRLAEGTLTANDGTTIELSRPTLVGWRESNAWNPDQKVFFAIGLDAPIERILFSEDSTQAIVMLDQKLRETTLSVGLSSVDEVGAACHVEHYGYQDFDAVRKAADQTWHNALSKIETQGGSTKDRRNFYTAMYHCMTSPNLYSDEDGRYRGMDDKIHKTDPKHPRYTVFSLWDTYRALNPLLSMIEPERTADFVRTMLGQYEEGGELTMWELWGHETHCMIGYHACPVILDAYTNHALDGWIDEAAQQGVNPVAQLLVAMTATSNRTEAHRSYAANGYLDAQMDNESVSKTLEYAYDDWCIAQLAYEAGHTDKGWREPERTRVKDSLTMVDYRSIYETYIRRSQSWQNIMDGDGFMHARRNGGFITPFDPREVNNNYTEANCWQASSYVPHDIAGWVAAHGGPEQTEQWLDSLFNSSSDMTGRDQSDITGMIGQYAHGNEPSHHAAYLYCYLGNPDKTQALVDQILHSLYSPTPDGLCGNEDCGQMSAWYVLSSIGMYPVCPGSGEMVTVKPIFSKVVIHRPGNNRADIQIDRKNWPLGQWFAPCSTDGQLAFRESSLVAIPDEYRCTPIPYFDDWQQRFSGSKTITLNAPADCKIYYTINGAEPSDSSRLYTQPFKVNEDVVIKARAFNETSGWSKTVVQRLIEYTTDKKLTYVTQPAQQYYENGEEGLIDHLYGTANYRIGGWQGWQGDMEVVIDLEAERQVVRVGVDCLENMRSWIFFPKSIDIYCSNDGKNYKKYGSVSNSSFSPTLDRQEESVTHTFSVNNAVSCRYLKVKANNFGALPQWHVSAGEQAWLFVDEIEVEQASKKD